MTNIFQMGWNHQLDVPKVEGIMDICEDREAAKPLIFCVVARDGMTSKVGNSEETTGC